MRSFKKLGLIAAAVATLALASCSPSGDPGHPASSTGQPPAEASSEAPASEAPPEAADQLTGTVTISGGSYDGYTIDYDIAIEPFDPASVIREPARQLGSSMIHASTNVTATFTNTTPGGRPITFVDGTQSLILWAVYAGDSALCTGGPTTGQGCSPGRVEIPAAQLGAESDGTSTGFVFPSGQPLSTRLPIEVNAEVPDAQIEAAAEAILSPAGFGFGIGQPGGFSDWEFANSLCHQTSMTGAAGQDVFAVSGDVSLCE